MILNLPKNCSAFEDRHGKLRIRFRKTGLKTHYAESPYPSKAFDRELEDWRNSGGQSCAPRKKVIPGSIDDLAIKFTASSSFKGNNTTKAKKRAIIARFRDRVGKDGKRNGIRPAATCPYIKLDEYITGLSVKQPDGSGGPEAADRARKILKAMFRFAVKIGIRDNNPMEFVESTSAHTDGFHRWSEEEIAQYQARHPIGTMARLALELMLWTGRRPTDASQLGKQHRKGDYLEGRNSKGGKTWVLPIMPDLKAAIDAVPRPSEELTFILNHHGRPFTSKGFNNRFGEWCNQAGLPTKCRAHGLRKAFLSRMAEAQGTQQQLKAAAQHSNDREVATYVATANQKRLAESGMKLMQDYVNWLTQNEVSQKETS